MKKKKGSMELLRGCWLKKKKDKVDKDVMLDRMLQIEAMLTAAVRRYAINTWF
ncbi:hypothetical protein HanPI659440_Chr14g0528141 [Helianthus annuus]|nr:hypothetical protein HanPI659440_Chr14g0528141 [Helianthus annuus]